ncbi:hypothetical protein [Spirosoma aerophilum]
MKPNEPTAFWAVISTVLFFCLVSCDPNKVATEKANAYQKATGNWHLVSTTSGWTGQTTLSTEKIDMTITEQQQATIYKDAIEVSRYQFTLDKTTSETLLFTVTQQSGNSSIFLAGGGYLKVNNKQLVIDYTFTDGPAYTFERNYGL